MSAARGNSMGYWQPAPLLAGLSWALFAATRWALVMTAGELDQTTVLWVWPPWWQPLLIGLAAWVLQYFAANWQQGWLVHQGLDRPRARRLAADAWWPSLALLLVPALELFAPLYSYSTAPLALAREAWPLAALAVAGATWLQTRLAAPELLGGGRQREFKFWLAPLVFVLALGVFAGVGVRLNQVTHKVGYLMGGDEPAYLLITHSIAVDHDLDLTNNLFLKENSFFMDAGRLASGHGGWTLDRTWLSKHRPGLPLIMSPFYAWGLYSGQGARKVSTILIWLLAAWMVLEVFWLSRLCTGREGPSLLAAAAACLALPGLIYSNLVFPDMAAAAFGVAAFRRLRQAPVGAWGVMLLAGVLTAYLGWFHERFILLSLLLAIYALARGHWRSLKDLVAFLAPCLLSAWLLAVYFNFLYGQPFPGPDIHAQGSYLNPRGAWEGLSGLWVDAAEGLLPYGAVWLAAVAGLLWLLRRRFADGFWVLVMATATYLTAGLFTDWFGGINPPSRYLMAAIPFLAVGLAAGARWAPRRFVLATLVLGVLTIASGLFVMEYPSAVYGHKVALGQNFQFPLVDNLLPAYIFNPEQAGINSRLAAIWMCLAGVLVLALQIDGQRFAPKASLLGLIAVFLVINTAAIAADRLGPGITTYGNPAHRIALWQRVNSFPQGGFSWQGGSGLAPGKALLELPIKPSLYSRLPARPLAHSPGAVETPAGAKHGLFIWGEYLTLPPGRYRASARLSSPYQGSQQVAWLDVSKEQGRAVLARLDVSGSQLDQPLSLEFQLEQKTPQVEIRLGTTGKARLVVQRMALTRLFRLQ
jgi:hypothetical protein